MNAPDYNKEPWRHPRAWRGHVVRFTLGCDAGVEIRIATCECGWSVCTRLDHGRAILDVAQNDHWRGVIAEAEAVPA